MAKNVSLSTTWGLFFRVCYTTANISLTMPDFELKNITIDPQPPPSSIEVVFLIGYNPTLNPTCERFARHFDSQFLSVSTYLSSISKSGRLRCEYDDHERQRVLSLLHRVAFDSMIDKRQPIPAFFLIPILHRKIDGEVRNGHCKFLIAGLGDDREAWKKFVEKVSISSTLSFLWDEANTTEDCSAFGDILLLPRHR